MADLLAIISADRSRSVAIEELSASYEELRGAPTAAETASAGWAAVRVLDRPQPPLLGLAADGDGWSAWAGPLGDPGQATAPLGELEGQFALARLEPGGETLRVATDPLGLMPLFTAQVGELSYFSTSALVLARHLRLAPSRLGLEAFLRTGNQLGRLTPWEGVERLGPAESIAFTPRGRRAEAYWLPSVDPAIRELDFRACAEACAERAVAAIASRYRGQRPWVDLTGGFDTRLLALQAQSAELGFLTNTIGDEDSEDVQLAREIAAAANWPWTRFDLPEDWAELLPARISEAVAWGDGHLEALGLTEVIEGHRAKASTESLLLNGGGGEHYRDYPWGQELLSANRSTKVHFDRLLAWRVLGPLDVSVFRQDPTAAVGAALRGELEHRVEPFAGTPNTFQCDLIYALKATGHFGAYQSSAAGWVHMELPFYLKPVFASAISAAPRHRNFHRLMREMMAQLDPAIAAIQTETGGPAEPLRLGNLPRFAPYPWRRGKRFAARLRGRVLGPGGGDSPPSQRELGRGRLIETLRAEGRLDPARMRSAALYDSQRLEQLLEAGAGNPAAADWTLLGRIVTSELALEAADAGLS
jgi:hypothetical protein